ncbi:transcriptional regulator, LysR family [Selenomonas ruminantium]|uniref:Transcriptional regulator, LysR family n=1 Tax=Selenomonas ruminantium TaxID=971 RepID=A0A1I3BLM4_SELRU|nr:LysR family transcriptional regulator [Selenomonas ruminantium]SFH63195.1 transcriptional regulator, LysR family [Selenomonas ruminantium]
MDLKQLKYFLTVVDERQITAAARKLHMAQPPLSQQMKLLESELGTELFKRGPHHIELTAAGRLLTRRAQQLLALADSTSREIADLCQGLRGTLAIGTISSSSSILWHPGLQRFQQQYRDVHFEIYDANTYQLIELLEKGVIEIGIVRTPFNASQFHCAYLEPEPMIAAMTAGLDWCPGRDTIALHELDQRQLIIYRRFHRVLDDAFTAQAIQPEIYCRNDDARTTILWANAGLGIAITPASAANLAAHEQLHIKKIDEPSLATRIAIIWRRDAYLSNLAEKFLAALNIPADGSSQPLNQEVHLCPTKK